MPSRRDEIKLTDDELDELIADGRVVTIATFGLRGWPHVMRLCNGPRDGEIRVYTHAKSRRSATSPHTV